MDVTVSRRNHINKRGNKENAQPAHGSKSFIKRDKTSLAPFHVKGNENEEKLERNGRLKPKAKQADARSVSGEAVKKVKTIQKLGKGAATASDVTQRQTYSRAFHTEQVVKHKKMVAEAPKPPAAVQTSKPAPGMYKGKIVQSRIGSIWKSSASLDRVDHKPAPKTESQRVGIVTKTKSKSVSDLPAHDAHKPAPTRFKPGLNRPAQVSKPAASRPPAGFYSARPAARTVPLTVTSTTSRRTTVAPTKASGTQMSKPKMSATDKMVNKPPVSNSLSQYRFTMETAEERRAKLAAWQASKGKTFKRPAMTTALPQKTRVSKPEVDLTSQPHVEPQPVTQFTSNPSLEAHGPDSALTCADTQGTTHPTYSQAPEIMNTSLELLENSETDLPVYLQDTMDDVVVNLCDALEAMETPSRCSSGEVSQVSEERNVDQEAEELRLDCTEEAASDLLQDVCEQSEVEQVKDETEESEDKVTDDAEEVESDSDSDVMETTPPMEEASVVKYSVKTTPYLQSVKKTMEGEGSTSRRKSNIKDLKFLTPVRRSCRIQRKTSCLPAMLVEQDPCVSSLAELVKLDDDPNAYIYRKNPALLDDLPDQSSL